MLVTDAQIHLWELDRPDRPWPKPVRGVAQREGGFSVEEALTEMDAAGVDRAIVVPPTLVGEMNSTAVEAAERYPNRFAVMGRFDPNAPDMKEQVAGWLEQPQMLGIRLTFFSVPRLEQLDDGSLDPFWAACERHQVPLMMLMMGVPEKVASIAERHPELTMIMDHMALDLRVDPSASWESIPRLLALAQFPKVFVKVSSAPNFSAEPYPHGDIHPRLRQLYDAYGARRLFWGSDVTRLEGTYDDCRKLFQEELDFLSGEDRELIMGKALSEVLKWPASEA